MNISLVSPTKEHILWCPSPSLYSCVILRWLVISFARIQNNETSIQGGSNLFQFHILEEGFFSLNFLFEKFSVLSLWQYSIGCIEGWYVCYFEAYKIHWFSFARSTCCLPAVLFTIVPNRSLLNLIYILQEVVCDTLVLPNSESTSIPCMLAEVININWYHTNNQHSAGVKASARTHSETDYMALLSSSFGSITFRNNKV